MKYNPIDTITNIAKEITLKNLIQPFTLLFLSAVFSIPAMAETSDKLNALNTSDNLVVKEIFDNDQGDRKSHPIDWNVVRPRDVARRALIAPLLISGALKTSKDFERAAFVYQHGDTADDYRTAFALAQVAVTIDPKNIDAKWLTAATWDRLMLQLKQPQWYGTQFVRDGSGKLIPYKTDPSVVSNEERALFNVPPLEDAQKQADEMNARK